MIVKSCFWVLTLCICAGGIMAKTPEGQRYLDVSMVNAFQACIDAQLSIANPYWDSQSRLPKQGEVDDYMVDFHHVPTMSVYHITITLKRPYPDALWLSCRLDAKTDDVLQVLYSWGEGLDHSKEVSLKDHDPLSGIATEDLHILVKEVNIQSFPLAEFYD